jgi:aspartokinase/homoserine dehydrogenase 1
VSIASNSVGIRTRNSEYRQTGDSDMSHEPANHASRKLELGILPAAACAPDDAVQLRPLPVDRLRSNTRTALRVMKFGGTSVGDASCISRVAEIVRAGAHDASLVVVVSAMSGVTNKLLEAASTAAAGDSGRLTAILELLRQQHHSAAGTLVDCVADHQLLIRALDALLHETECLCHDVLRARKLTPQSRDAISGFGERFCVLLVTAALTQRGVSSRSIDATELIATDANHGSADPQMHLTKLQCEQRLRPLLNQGIIPVVTGFIGATAGGVPTTLGRGGSDFSATILGAALGAAEVVIWTDVDGVLTADPRLVSGTCAIAEISYREAADLAHFGAKVLHPKTLRPVSASGVPVSIRNTFSPAHPGTKITSTARPTDSGVRAITAIGDMALITVGDTAIVGVPNLLGRTFTTLAALHADIFLISQSSSQNDICFVVPAAVAAPVAEALHREFASDLPDETIVVNAAVAIVTLVGQNIGLGSGLTGRTLSALGRENLNVVAIAQGSSGCNVSVVVAQEHMGPALVAAHREFRLGAARPISSSHQQPTSEPFTAANL